MFKQTKNLKPFVLILVACISLAFAPPIKAKAYHPPAREMIQKAEYIALVTLEEPVKIEKKGGSNWTYAEVTDAKLTKSLKGNLPGKFKIHGKEDFICAQCHFPRGESLVFLKKDHDLYVGQAWQISCLPVKAGKASWFSNLDRNSPDTEAPVEECIKQIRTELKQ